MASSFLHEELSSSSECSSDFENSSWIGENYSMCDSPAENSTNTSTAGTSFYSASTSSYVIASLYWIIFTVGVIGNLLVLAVVIRRLLKSSPQHQAMMIFVGSLSVSDLGLLLWVTCSNALLSVNPEWFSGKLHCEMYTFWRSMTADCSICTLMFIALDRCLHSNCSSSCLWLLLPCVLKMTAGFYSV